MSISKWYTNDVWNDAIYWETNIVADHILYLILSDYSFQKFKPSWGTGKLFYYKTFSKELDPEMELFAN